MSSPRFLDTNVLIRYFTHDDPETGRRAFDLVALVDRGEEVVILSHLVLFEVIFTLQKTYQIERPNILTWLEALAIFVESNISFADVYNAIFMRRAGVAEVYSWDSDFDRLPWVTRVEP